MVAILEDDQVAEVFVERERQRGVVGNVYKGRVSKVLPGMQSAFVDIGLERDGFLYVSDVIADLDEYDKDETIATAAGAEGPTADRPRRRRRAAIGGGAAATRTERAATAAGEGRQERERRAEDRRRC